MKRIAAIAVAAILLTLGVSATCLHHDKEQVFFEIRGTYSNAVGRDRRETPAGGIARRLALANQAGREVTDILVRRPADPDPGYRIWLIYAGAKTGERILQLVPERPDVVLVSVQYPYDSPEGAMEHLRWPYDIRRAAFRSVAGGMLALDFLESDEGLDLDRVVVVGISVGVPFATMLAALDERVPKVMLIHGGGDLAAQVRATQEPRWLAIPSSLLAQLLFHSFEPLNYVHRIAPRELVMIAARDESILPRASIDKLFAAAGEPKRLIWTDTDHVRSRHADTVERIVRQIEHYMSASDNESGRLNENDAGESQ